MNKNIYTWALMTLLILAVAFAATPTYTYLSDGNSWFAGNVGIGTDSPSSELEIEDGTLTIDQNGNGISLNVDSEATTSNAIRLDTRISASGGTTNRHSIFAGNTGAGGAAMFRSNSGTATTEPTVTVQNLESTSTGMALNVYNEGTGNALFIDQQGDQSALAVYTQSTDKPTIRASNNQGGCSVGYYGFYTSGGDLFWCKNGVSTQLN